MTHLLYNIKPKGKEDPLLYKSSKTGRGPLPKDWLRRQKNGEYGNREIVLQIKL